MVVGPLHRVDPHFNIMRLILFLHYYLLFTDKEVKTQKLRRQVPVTQLRECERAGYRSSCSCRKPESPIHSSNSEDRLFVILVRKSH